MSEDINSVLFAAARLLGQITFASLCCYAGYHLIPYFETLKGVI